MPLGPIQRVVCSPGVSHVSLWVIWTYRPPSHFSPAHLTPTFHCAAGVAILLSTKSLIFPSSACWTQLLSLTDTPFWIRYFTWTEPGFSVPPHTAWLGSGCYRVSLRRWEVDTHTQKRHCLRCLLLPSAPLLGESSHPQFLLHFCCCTALVT